MEALAALGLVGNIITLIDFSSKLVNAAKSVRNSASGLPGGLEDATIITRNLQSFLTQLPAPILPPAASTADKSLAELMVNCRNVCDQLQQLIQKIKGNNGSGSRIDNFRVGFRGLRKKEELQELEKRLHAYRSQIMEHFHRIFQEEQSSKLHTLVDSQAGMAGALAKETERQLGETRKEILRMMEHTSASSTSASSNAIRIIRDRLTDLSARTRTFNAEQEVLNLLWFPELQMRKNSVDNASKGTYRWLLHDPKSDTEHEDLPPPASSDRENKSLPPSTAEFARVHYMEEEERENKEKSVWRDRFVNWLRDEEGPGSFFISGKPGAGKSTLMKYISQDPRTRQLLDAWATKNEKQLILLSFYFWISGNSLQKTMEGLYRSMLWEILRQAPDLIAHTFPALFSKASAEPLHISDLESSDLSIIFKSLLQNEVLLQKYNLCFFIDGLDEFDGDHMKLAINLKSWCSACSIKICVSSRPRNAFISIFGRPGPWLKLHELTREDIRRMVRDQFAADERVTESQQHSSGFDQLAQSIVKKAEGVFIWVVLTIRSLLDGIGDSCSMIQLQRRMDFIPTELDDMFRYMLDRMHQSEKKAASRLFLTQLIPSTSFASWAIHSLHIQSLLDDTYDDPTNEQSLIDGALGQPWNIEECDAKCLAMGDRITGRCQGLIAVDSFFGASPMHSRIQFVHRTVADFLNQPETISMLRYNAGAFDPCRALILGILAMLKHGAGLVSLRPPAPSMWTMDQLSTAGTILNLCSWAEQAGCPPYSLEIRSMTDMIIKNETGPKDTSAWLHWVGPSPWTELLGAKTPAKIETAISIEAMRARAFSFVNERLSGSKLEATWALVGPSVEDYWGYTGPRLDDFTTLITHMLERETSLNDELPGFSKVPLSQTFEVPTSLAEYYCSARWTPWALLLRKAADELFLCRYANKRRDDLCIYNMKRSIEMLLDHGADPDMFLIGYDVSKLLAQDHEKLKSMEPTELRTLARGPLKMALAMFFSIWKLKINCAAYDVSSRKLSGCEDVKSQKLPSYTRSGDGLLAPTLPDSNTSEACFIVVQVVSHDQLELRDFQALHMKSSWEYVLDDTISTCLR